MTAILFLFLQKHPGIFNQNELNISLEVQHEMGQRLQRKDGLSSNQQTSLRQLTSNSTLSAVENRLLFSSVKDRGMYTILFRFLLIPVHAHSVGFCRGLSVSITTEPQLPMSLSHIISYVITRHGVIRTRLRDALQNPAFPLCFDSMFIYKYA